MSPPCHLPAALCHPSALPMPSPCHPCALPMPSRAIPMPPLCFPMPGALQAAGLSLSSHPAARSRAVAGAQDLTRACPYIWASRWFLRDSAPPRHRSPKSFSCPAPALGPSPTCRARSCPQRQRSQHQRVSPSPRGDAQAREAKALGAQHPAALCRARAGRRSRAHPQPQHPSSWWLRAGG